MKTRNVCAALAATVLLGAAPAMPRGTYEHDERAIVLVRCGPIAGSAFKVGASTYVTADHVVGGRDCTVNGAPIEVTHRDEKRDYATFVGPASPAMFKTSCAGFTSGKTYFARGFPGGGTFNIYTPWIAMPLVVEQFRVFMASDAIPGMSGGVVMDESGAAVGVINKRYPARSMALKFTGFCKR